MEHILSGYAPAPVIRCQRSVVSFLCRTLSDIPEPRMPKAGYYSTPISKGKR